MADVGSPRAKRAVSITRTIAPRGITLITGRVLFDCRGGARRAVLRRVAAPQGDALVRRGRDAGQLRQGWPQNTYLLSFLQVNQLLPSAAFTQAPNQVPCATARLQPRT